MALLTLAGNVLPDLFWEDEFDWSSVVQSLSRTEAGVLVREESAVVAGRPITLVGSAEYGWALRALIKTLHTLQQTANAAPMTLLVPDGRTFTVVWRREGNGAPMSARPVLGPLANPADTDYYELTLRLVTTA